MALGTDSRLGECPADGKPHDSNFCLVDGILHSVKGILSEASSYTLIDVPSWTELSPSLRIKFFKAPFYGISIVVKGRAMNKRFSLAYHASPSRRRYIRRGAARESLTDRISIIGVSCLASPQIEAFRKGLRDVGYIEGQNIASEYRYAEGQRGRQPECAAELVRLKVDII